MIHIAHEVGSAEFEPALRRLNLPCEVRNLSSADFCFWGDGPDGPCRVGIERKTVAEMVGASSRKRLVGHQLSRMTARYRFRFLLIEGLVRMDPAWGMLHVAKSTSKPHVTVWVEAGWAREGATYDQYLKRQLTLRLKAVIHPVPTADKTETAYAVAGIYHWFQRPWASHKSHLLVDEALPDRALLEGRTLKRQLLAQIPHVGWERSAALAKQFDRESPGEMLAWVARATVKDWQRALRIAKGEKTAQKIVDALRDATAEAKA